MSLTTDPNDPRLGHGGDDKPGPQNEVYLVLSEEERAKGFVRPVRRAYTHVGRHFTGQTRALTEDEKSRFVSPDDGENTFVLVEMLPDGKERFWTRAEYAQVGKGCRTTTTMGLALCETYARDPKFYGATYCCGCEMHKPVREFKWVEDGQTVGS